MMKEVIARHLEAGYIVFSNQTKYSSSFLLLSSSAALVTPPPPPPPFLHGTGQEKKKRCRTTLCCSQSHHALQCICFSKVVQSPVSKGRKKALLTYTKKVYLVTVTS